MKNVYRSIIFVVAIVLSIQTQAQIRFGVKAGLNFSNRACNYDNSFNTIMKMGYNVGLITDYELNEKVNLQSGLSLSTKGYNVKDDIFDSKVVYAYIEVPIHFAYKINEFQIFGGPYFGFGIGGSAEGYFENNNETQYFSYTMKPFFGTVMKGDLDKNELAFNAFDYGFDLGVGYQIGDVLINAKYAIGFGKLSPNYEEFHNTNNYKSMNRVFSFSVSYFFKK